MTSGTMSARIACGLLALFCPACGVGDGPGRDWPGVVDTLAGGVIQVRNPETGIWSDDEGWRIVEEVRIGAAAGDGPEAFSQIAAVGASPDGLIHVIDGHTQEVRVFTPAGEHVRTFGGRGAGPGEFTNAFSLDWDAHGRLWINDPGNNRYAVFDTAGSLLFRSPRRVPGLVFPWLGGFGRSGAYYDVAAGAGPDGLSARSSSGSSSTRMAAST